MPDVSFKDLCIDVTHTVGLEARVAAFWSAALGQDFAQLDNGAFVIEPPPGTAESRRIWLCSVPELCTTKSRVHIDIRLPEGDPTPLVAAGGHVLREPTTHDRWHVVEAPDGIPVCVMGPHPRLPAFSGPFELVVDSAHPLEIAQWWADRTGGTAHTRDNTEFVWIEGASGFPYMFWVFTQVPEPKTVKNRVHWDVTLLDATVGDLVSNGATLLRAEDNEVQWTVLADPEGNEFCAFAQP